MPAPHPAPQPRHTQHPRQFTGHPIAGSILTVWYNAFTESGPLTWDDMHKLIRQPWIANLLVAQGHLGMRRPLWCVALGPLAASLVGLEPSFFGELPSDHARRLALCFTARLVSKQRRMVFKGMPVMYGDDGKLNRPWSLALPLTPAPAEINPDGVERVLFAIVTPRKNAPWNDSPRKHSPRNNGG